MQETISFEQFKNELFVLNQSGNVDQIYQLAMQVLGSTLPDGTVFTFKEMVNRYRNYVLYCKQYETDDKKYQKKDKEIKPIGEWIVIDGYKQDYGKLMIHSSDFYLFGRL